MRQSESNKLNMYNAVISFLKSNAEKHSSVPVISETLAKLEGIVDEIKSPSSNFVGQTKDETLNKKLIEDELIEKTLQAANILRALGIRIKDTELMVNAKLAKRDLAAVSDNKMLDKCKEIIVMLTENKDQLTNYGFTEEMLTNLQQLTDDFSDAIDKRSDERANLRAAREKLYDLFDEADKLLKDELDLMMEIFVTSDKVFYNGYKAARVIYDLGGKKSTSNDSQSSEEQE